MAAARRAADSSRRGGKLALLAAVALFTAAALGGCGKPADVESPSAPREAKARAPRTDGRPNIVLITVESLRTDHVGAYGGRSRSRPDVPLTPAIDALAAEGMVYEDAHSVTSWTLASHASLFTGLYPGAHQTRHSTDRLGDAYQTLAERLAASGYDTGGVVSGPYLRRSHNLSQGFVHYHDDIASDSQVEAHGQTTNPRMLDGMQRSIDDELAPDRPFFLFAYFWDPHYDYLPPPPYDSMFVADDSEPIDMHDYETTDTVHPGIRKGQLSYVFSQYAGEIRWTDLHLGRFFQFLKDRGLWDDTVVILTADHGEEFFDHGEKGHYHNVYAETVHVPLIVKYAKGGPVGRDSRLASLVDVVPTALELAGAPEGPGLDGRSLLEELPAADRAVFYDLLSVWRVTGGDAPSGFFGGVRALWNFLVSPPPAPKISSRTWSGVRQGDFKLVVSPELGRRELYDARHDPVEAANVVSSNAEKASGLEKLLDDWQKAEARTAAGYASGGEAQLTPKETEHLKSLGYIQ